MAIALIALACAPPAALHAQFMIEGRRVQIHGFASQGFAYSNDNNYLTMKTSNGSFAFTDGGANISTQITDNLRVGAQIYVRNIGELGKGYPELDWATVDYKFTSWFGLRGGKVKTMLGLYSDSQDIMSLHTWAILPQSLYPLDLRSTTIAHAGGDVYGDMSLKRLGAISYTVYAGARPDDAHGGYRYSADNVGISFDGKINGSMHGADLRWSTPAPGLTVGATRLILNLSGKASVPGTPLKGDFSSDVATSAFYTDFVRGNLRLSGEYRRTTGTGELDLGGPQVFAFDQRGWYISASYRLSKHLEIGAYDSHWIPDWKKSWDPPDGHLVDRTVAARVDLSNHWNVKIEGHFIDGYGDPINAAGFYRRQNPNGYQPKTNMLVIRAGFIF